jgi:hypothetical protein
MKMLPKKITLVLRSHTSGKVGALVLREDNAVKWWRKE